MEWVIVKSDEISHEGKKGMHWGERKYQNKDGTWTPLGLKLRRMREGANDRKARAEEEKANKRAKKQEAKDQKLATRLMNKEARAEAKAERHELNKQKALASGNARKIAKYQSELTPQEVENAISRINLMTRMDQAKEAQAKVGTDKLNRVTSTVRNTANNVVDVYDTAAAVANATGLIEKELPVIFKDQKRKGVTMFDRGRERRVQAGTATDQEERELMSERSRRLERGDLNDHERESYRQMLEGRQARGEASDRDRADLSRMNEQDRNRQRSILTPRPEDYNREEADARNRQAATTASNADRLRRLYNAANEAYGSNDPRTIELANASEAMTNLSGIAQDRAGRYNAANPNVRSNMRNKARRNLDRSVSADAAYRRARTQEERQARDTELANRARQVDEAYAAVRNIDMDDINNRFASLDNLANSTPGSISWVNERERLRNTHISI